jgi:hypothetical protein
VNAEGTAIRSPPSAQVQLRKAQVVAHAQAEAQARRRQVERHRLAAGLEHERLVVALGAVVEAEQVHLVVARREAAVGGEDAAGVAHPARIARYAQRQGAAHDPER